ncbi:MAG: tetratricopeptide repeat protein [Acidobacteria bacterium]|nr:tetratricopeptide repeat protein [Acidobacteriota bacterium]
MKSVPNPSLRGMTTDLLKNLDAQERLRAGSVRAAKSNQVRFQSDSNKRLKSDTESQHRLAVLYHAQKKFEQAERLYQECLTQYSLKYGSQDPRVGQCLNNVGRLYFEEGWYAEAEPLLERSLQIVRNHYGP